MGVVIAIFFLGLIGLLIYAAVKAFLLGQTVKKLEQDFRLFRDMQFRSRQAPSQKPVAEQPAEQTETKARTEPSPEEKDIVPEKIPVEKQAEAEPVLEPVEQYAYSQELPQDTYVQPEEAPKPSRTREEWESFIGGKLLNRIGALALVIATGFFLKYAFDKNWINEFVRVGIGFLSGGILILAGWRFHKKNYQVFAQGLIGSGIAILYLSVYASFNFYHLLDQVTAFILMSCVTAYTLYLGVRYNSIAVALLGLLGGFLTPIMLSTGSANEVGLFTYICILDAGLLLLYIKKKEWEVIFPLVLAGTYSLYFAWYAEHYVSSDLSITILFLSLFFLLFLAVELYNILTSKTEMSVLAHITHAFSVTLFYFGMDNIIDADLPDWTGAMTLATGLVYYLVFFIYTKKDTSRGYIHKRQIITAIILTVIATFIEFEELEASLAFSIEALVLVFLGLKFKYNIIWKFGLIIFLFSVLQFIFTRSAYVYYETDNYMLIMNFRALSIFLCAAAIFISQWQFLKSDPDRFSKIVSVLNYSWISIIFLLITAEIFDYISYLQIEASSDKLDILNFNRQMILCSFWAFYSCCLIIFGFVKNKLPLINMAMIISAISLLVVIISGADFKPDSEFLLAFNSRFMAFLILIGLLSLFVYLFNKHIDKFDWINSAKTTSIVVLILFVLVLLSVEAIDHFNKMKMALTYGDDSYNSVNNMMHISISGVWLLYSILAMILGLWRKNRIIRIVSIVIMGISILKVFIYDLSFLDTLYRIFSFVALGVILLLASFLYQRFKDVIIKD